MLNHIVIQGRLTREPELRRTSSGTAVCGFSLAVERDYRDQDGERGVDFIDCVAWRGNAEFVAKYFTKGQLMIVAGRLSIRNWTDTDGSRRRNADVITENCYFCDSKRTAGEPRQAQNEFTTLEGDDHDLPF